MFDQPTVLTDNTVIPRQTYYACPFCQSKLNILTDNMKIVGVKATEYPKVFESPAKCPHHGGFLSATPKEEPISDDCLLCPKVLQCSARQNQT